MDLGPDPEDKKERDREVVACYTFGIVRPGEQRATVLSQHYRTWEGPETGMTGERLLARIELLDRKRGWMGEDGSVLFEITLSLLSGAPDVEKSKCMARQSAMAQLYADLGGLLESGFNSDVVIQCGGEDFKAHKAILAARSPVFKAMFSHGMAECKEGRTIISEIEPAVFRELLRFLYTGSCRVEAPDTDVDWECKLFAAAHRFQVSGLLAVLETTLCTQPLNADAFMSRLQLAELYQLSNLKEHCAAFLRADPANVKAVMESKSFEASRRNPDELLAVIILLLTERGRLQQ